MNNQKIQNEVGLKPENNNKLLPSMEDVAELAGIETLHPGGFDLSKRIGEIVDMKNKKVLEVGSGRGIFACYFAKNCGAKITGIDISPGMIESSVVRAKNEGVQSSTEFRVANALSLPFPDNSFDIVVSECGPVGLATEPQKVVNEMVRVIRPDGYMVAHAPMWLKEISEEERKDIEKRIGGQMFTLSEWKSMLKKAGAIEIWEEDWSGVEQIRKVRPGRKINNMSDVFTLWEKIGVVLPRVLWKYGLKSLFYLNESFRKVSPLFYNGTIGTYLLRAQKPITKI
jgi:SAM-dependent methyltransferase